nr:M23 family metallopeptidase [Motiliproteus sp. SC1-56]
MGKVGKYLFGLFVLMSLASFFISNALLVKTSEELTSLTQDHQLLANLYTDAVDSRESVRTELDKLANTLNAVQADRAKVTDERERWRRPLRALELELGLEPSTQMTLERGRELRRIANERLFMLRGLPNGYPIEGIAPSDRFGMRKHPVTGERKHHNGIDFSADRGTPVYATADGAVEYAGYHKSSGYGNLIIINHNFGFKSYYGHLKKREVNSGSLVRKGQLIGYSGNTGLSTGPHLHYEVRYLFKPLDPQPFLDWGMENYTAIFEQVEGISWDSLRQFAALTLPTPSPEAPLAASP